MKSKFITMVLRFAVLLFSASAASAATLTVTKVFDTNDGVCNADCSLREAIFAAAASGDVIEFALPLFDTAQTITLTLGALFQDKTLTINGRGADLTRVSGNNVTRVFLTGNNGNSTLNNLTITGGRDTGVGGSGIYNDGIMTINNCVISGNNGTNRGGGIVNPAGKTLIINDTLITNNSVSNTGIIQGGGIFNAGQMEIRRSTVSGNVVSVPITMTSNGAPEGGGIFNRGTLIVESSTLSGNQASGPTSVFGGAIHNISTLILTNTTVSGNTTSPASGNGGIYNSSGNLLMTNSTVTRNSSGIEKAGGTITAINSIISGNSGINLMGSLNVNTANLIDGNARLAPLSNYGGATQTHALLPDSPAVNAGNNCVLTANGCGTNNPALTTDQRGAGFARLSETAVDIGAYELQTPTTNVVTKIADSNDGVCDADCSLREAVSAAIPGELKIEFASPLFDTTQTITLTLGQLTINKSISINGRNANLTRISANNLSRVFQVNRGFILMLNGVTVTGGRADTSGGGIFNNGAYLGITNSSIVGNSVANAPNNNGGGIFNTNGGTLAVMNSTISGNSSIGGNAGNAGNYGGGIYSDSVLNITNSTISGNSVGGGSAENQGGGIFTTTTTSIINSTVTNNSANNVGAAGGGIFRTNANTLHVRNTIISGNTAAANADLSGSLATNTSNFIGGNAQLAPLGNNGGATQTHLPLSGSPVINAGNNCVLTANGCGGEENPALITDQRGAGFSRFLGTAVDIGAVEDSRGSVINANNSGAGSLRQVIEDAPAGGTIRFDPAFFNQPRTIGAGISINKNLTLLGPGANLLTLDANNSFRALNIGAGATVTLSGVRIYRGRTFSPDAGAGIFINLTSTLHATGIIVEDSNADNGSGGGIYNSGTLNLTDSTVRGNTAGQQGGGIYNAGTLTAINSTLISGNTAAFGGGIYNDCAHTATVNNSIISSNTSTGGAGGIGNCGTLNVFGSTFSGNSATFGGALTAGTTSIINNSTISGNTATTDKAGAVYIGTTDRLDTTNTTITNNVSNANLTGGIYSDGGLYQTRNSIIAGNRNGNGSGAPDIAASITSFGYNLIGSTTGNSFAAGSPNLTGNLTNVSANLAPLANYGGILQTHALLSNSPAINAGDPNNSFTTDQRGSLRPISGRTDIGAFERNIVFDQTTLPNGTQSAAYNQTLTITRLTSLVDEAQNSPENLAPFTFTIVPVAGQILPNGLTLSSDGQISGTPTATGSFTFTVKATDTDGIAGASQFTITIINTPPTISGATISRQAGSPVSNSTIATVNDLQSGANGVSVSITNANPSNGVTISNIVNTNGNVTANVIANCGATSANFTLTATDSNGATATAILTVTISANTAPTLVYSASSNVSSGGSINIIPTTATDNGTSSYSILSVSPVLTTAPTIDANGIVSITNANPIGNRTITIRATDNCSLTTDASFMLNVEPPIKTVTRIADTDDGVCDADCSLREAIATAVSGDTIQFAAPLFNTAQTIALTSELSVTGKNITITGRAANLTAISGENTSRVFNVGGGSNLTLNNLTVKNGRTTTEGGGIYNSATLTITNSTISGNSVSGGSDNFGGGVYNGSQATLTIRNSTISGNSVTGSGNFSNRGGGIANVNGTLVITNSTISGNSLGGGNNNRGGGIYTEYGTVTIINNTITANSIAAGGFNFGGGLGTLQDTLQLRNTIISGNSSGDVLGSYPTDSNFIDGDARLAPLGFYGGATQTHALLPDSPVLNAGNNCVLTTNLCVNGNSALTTDQRGSERRIAEIVDIGAFESSITFDQTILPDGNTNVNYNQQLSAIRQTNFAELQNVAPTVFEIVPVAGQSLPNGITLSSGGLLAGMPTNFGNFVFTVKAIDADGIAGVRQYSINVLSPTSANVTVSGSVKTANGSGIRNASITLTDLSGNVRKTQTGSFGNYKFDNIEAGQTYIISVSAKRFTFAQTSQVVAINEDAADVDFTAQE